MKKFTPVAEDGLVGGELQGQTEVAIHLPEKLRLRSRLDRLQLLGGHVLGFQTIELGMNRFGQFAGGVARGGDADECEEIGILVAGKAAESGCLDGQLLIANERAVEA